MKKRLLSLGLCLVLLLGTVLTGCDDSGNKDNAADNKNAITVTLAMSKGEGTTDEAAQMIEDAINVITEAKLNTHVELMLYDKADLKEAVLEKVDEISTRLQSGEEAAADTVEEDATDTVIVDEETGRKHTQYPEVASNQFDIILINGSEQYSEYMDHEIYYDGDRTTGILAELSPSVLLSQYVNASLLSAAKPSYDYSGVFAIPNNRDFGTYTYLVINKELADRYGYAAADLASHSVEKSAAGFVSSAECLLPFLTQVHNDNPSMRLVAGMPVPEASSYTFGPDVMVGRSQFVRYGNQLTFRLEAPPTNLYGADAIKNYFRLMHQLGQWGQKPTDESVDFSSDFAVAYVKGNATSIANVDTDKYYVAISDAPVRSNEYLFSSMYGVTKYSINAERAQEVVELFNTNKEFRNLMYYGIKDVHYMVDDKGEYIRLNHDWNMDLYDTGNLYLLARSRELGDYYYAMSEDSWAAGKSLNRDSVEGALLGFTYHQDKQTVDAVAALRTKCTQWNERLLNYTGDNINSEISAVKDALDASPEFKTLTNNDAASGSVYVQYRAWFSALAPAKG